jgi:flagellar capping protein FliD
MSTSSISSISGSITFTGLGSGTDFASITDQLLEIESIQKERMETWRETWEDRITSIEGLSERVVSLQEVTEAMDSFSEFYARVATSSDTSILTAVADSDALTGSNTLTVGTDIAHRLASKGVAATTTAVGSTGNDLEITVGSTTVTVTYVAVAPVAANGEYNENSTLDELRQAIDAADAAGSDVFEDVEIIDDGSDTNPYRLVITAKTGGSDSTITIDDGAGGGDPTNLSLDATSIDTAETKTWNGTATVTSGGTYTGATNKSFHFQIAQDSIVGVEDFTVVWNDDEGNSGAFTVTDDSAVTVYQGLTVSFSDADSVVAGDTFTIDVFSPTLQKGADSGLAQADQWYHDGFADSEVTYVHTGAVAGTFDYSYAGITESVTVEQDTTLAGLVELINSSSTNPGVTASIVNDGQGLATSYHLVLTGNQTGAAMVITNISETLDNFDGSSSEWTNTQVAQNAMLKIDGYPSTDYEYLQRARNTFDDVIDGVTISLVDTGTAKVTVNDDTSTVQSRIETFVSSVNFVLSYIKQETNYDEDTGESGIMIGNYVYDMILRQINDILTTSIPGLTDGVDTYTTLSQIGIMTDPDNEGLWYIDEDTLTEALDNDVQAVARLFVRDTVKDSEGVAYQLAQKTDELTDSVDGPMNILIDNYEGIIDEIDAKIEREERRLETVRSRYETMFASLEAALIELEQIQSYLDTQLDQLPGVSGD